MFMFIHAILCSVNIEYHEWLCEDIESLNSQWAVSFSWMFPLSEAWRRKDVNRIYNFPTWAQAVPLSLRTFSPAAGRVGAGLPSQNKASLFGSLFPATSSLSPLPPCMSVCLWTYNNYHHHHLYTCFPSLVSWSLEETLWTLTVPGLAPLFWMNLSFINPLSFVSISAAALVMLKRTLE